MAANYWESTQRRFWQFTKEQLAGMRQKLADDEQGLIQMFPLPQQRHLNIYFNQRESHSFEFLVDWTKADSRWQRRTDSESG